MMHSAILSAASLLVPRDHRAEWLDEWAAELAYILRESPRCATVFCLGAFRDALWLRRNTPRAETRSILLESPARCLLILAATAAIALAFAYRLPGTRGLFEPLTNPRGERLVVIERPAGRFTREQLRQLEQHLPQEFARGLSLDQGLVLARRKPGFAHTGPRWYIFIPSDNGEQMKLNCTELEAGRPLFALLIMAAMALPVLAGTTSLSLGQYPTRLSTHLRLRSFFAAKILLVVAIVFFGILDLGSAAVIEIRPHGLLLGFILAFRWALQDQRRRCPVCLHRLTNPIRFGQPSHAFLDWYGTELICSEGHGMMHVPEIPTSSYPEPRWVSLDA
jgi:hypothetical protein